MIKTIKDFKKKQGAYVLTSSMLVKISSFVISLLLIRILSTEEFGWFSYALSSLSFFIPFTGGGLQHSYLRFAPSISSDAKKSFLFNYSLRWGALFCILLVAIVWLAIPWITDEMEGASVYLQWLSFFIISFFFIDMVKVLYRVEGRNRSFAAIDVWSSLSLLFIGIAVAYIWSAKAYVIAYVLIPLLISIIYLRKIKLGESFSIPEKYWSYGLWVGLGAIASQLMYSLDVFLVGKLIQDPIQIAIYRSASIIPMALFFIPNAFMVTHYTELAEKSTDLKFLKNFAADYSKLFLFIAVSMVVFLIIISGILIPFLFGEAYIEAVFLFQILLIGLVGAFILRIPYGNLLAAVGHSDWNAWIAIGMLLLNVLLNYFAIIHWGIVGAAYVTSGLLWLSGLVSFLFFRKYLRGLSA